MSKNTDRPTVNYAQWREEQNAKRSIDLELANGTTMRIPPRFNWPMIDDGSKETIAEYAVRIVGQEAWDQFVSEGGNWSTINEIRTQQDGLPAGE